MPHHPVDTRVPGVTPKSALGSTAVQVRMLKSCIVRAMNCITVQLGAATGLIIHFIALTIPIPYFIKSKAWDVAITMMLLMPIGTGRLITAEIA